MVNNSSGELMIPTTLVQTRYGPMYVIDSDPWVSRSLQVLGEYSEREMDLVRSVFPLIKSLRPRFEVVDGGAYIGDMTIPLSRLADHVHAFEPQPEVREILEANLALNGITNVTVYPYALGHENKSLTFNSSGRSDPLSYGSQQMDLDAGPGIPVEMRTLDSLGIQAGFIKLDIEGFEYFALWGAKELLARDRPVLFLERDTVVIAGAPPIAEYLQRFGYVGYNLNCLMWNADNFNQTTEDIFYNVASLMTLGVPLVPLFTLNTQGT